MRTADLFIRQNIDSLRGRITTLMGLGFKRKDIQELIDSIFEDIERRNDESQISKNRK